MNKQKFKTFEELQKYLNNLPSDKKEEKEDGRNVK